MMNTIVATGAYGRDRQSPAKVLEDYMSYKDFTNNNVNIPGTYFSRNDEKLLVEQYGITHIQFRYNNNTEVFLYKVV